MQTFAIPHLTITAAIDILAVAAVVYQLLQIIRGRGHFISCLEF